MFCIKKVFFLAGIQLPLIAATLDVTSNSDSNLLGTLRYALINSGNGDTIEITLPSSSSTITLTSDLPVITHDLQIQVASTSAQVIIDGSSLHRIFAIGTQSSSPNVQISGVTCKNGLAQGGDGGSPPSSDVAGGLGGGGLGAGGAIFVKGDLTLSEVTIEQCKAAGGNGGTVSGPSSGVVYTGGGGGGGASFASSLKEGGSPIGTGGGNAGGNGGGDNFGNGGPAVTSSTAGIPGSPATGLSGGGGGGGGDSAQIQGGNGGFGGYGGGGGGGGDGFIHALGGSGGNGGYGAGGGGAGDGNAQAGLAGRYGGNGGHTLIVPPYGGAGGGGGAGIGGSIFVYDNSILSLKGSINISNGTCQGGIGGNGVSSDKSAADGQAFAEGIFLGNNAVLLLEGSFTAGFNIDSDPLSIDGGVSVTAQSGNNITLSGTNSYYGTTTIEGGTLRPSTASALGNTLEVHINNGATLDLPNLFDLDKDIILQSAGVAQVNVDASALASISSVISGGDSTFQKTGGGTLQLSGTNSYSGTTSITDGILQAGMANVFSPNSDVTVSSGATLDLNGNGNTIAGLNGAGSVTLGTGTLTINPGSLAPFSGGISGSGGLTKSGSGTQTLSGTNTYSGTTTISAGTLKLLGMNALGNTLEVHINNGATLDLPNLFDLDKDIILQSAGVAQVNVDASALASISSVISGGDSTFQKTGGGTLQLSGTNSYSGTTSITDGILQAGMANAFSPNSDVTVSSGATLDLNGNGNTIAGLNGAGSVTLGTGTLTVNPVITAVFSGGISGSGGLTKSGSGTQTLSGTNTYSGTTTISAGTLKLLGMNALGNTLEVHINNGATLDLPNLFDLDKDIILQSAGVAQVNVDASALASISSVISGGDSTFQKTGGGTLQLSGTNSYSGTTSITDGILQAGMANAFSPNSDVAVSSGATLDLNGNGNAIAGLNGAGSVNLGIGTLTVNLAGTAVFSGGISGSGGLTKVGSGTQTLSGTNTYSGTTTVSQGILQAGAVNTFSSNSDVSVSSGATLELDFYSNSIAGLSGAGSVNLGLGTLTVNPAVAAGFSGGISGLGGLTKIGSGTQTLSGINTYFGATTLIEGTIQAGAANAFSPNSGVTLSSGAILNLNDHDNQIFSVSGSGGNISLGSSSANLVINGIGTNTNFSGFISGKGVLVKEGSSTQILSGVNTFTGPTIIKGGRLAIHSPGSITSQVTVNASGTLSGTGTIIGNVQVENGGVILPGASVGTLTIQGNLGLSAGSQTNVDIDPFISSLIVVSGTADLDGTLNLLTSIEELYPATQVYTILRSEGGLLLDPNSASGFTEFKTVVPATFFEFSPIYFPDKVELHSIYTAPLIPTNGLTGNRLRLADYFNTESRFFFRTNLPLHDLSEEQIAPLLDSISPSRLSASSWAVANVGFGVAQQIRDRVEAFRFFHLNNQSANRSSSEEFSVYVASNKDDRMIPRGSVRIAEHNSSSFSAYANWFGQIIYQKEQQQNPAFTIFSNQANLGIEKYFTRGIIGLQANYAASTITQDHKSYSQLVGGSIYSAAFLNDLFVDTSFFGSRVWYESYRMIAIPQFDAEAIYGKAKSKHKGYCLLPHLGIGYDFVLSWGVLEPYLGVDWAFLHETAYTESGPALLNMHVYGRNSSLLRTQIGFNAYQAFENDCTTVMLKEEASYVYLKPDDLGRIKATVPGSLNNFTVYAMTNDQSRGKVGLELFIKKNSGFFFAGKYCLEAGSSAVEQNFSATIGKDF